MKLPSGIKLWPGDGASPAGAKAPPRSTCKTLQNDLVMMYCLHNGTDELVMAGERAVYMGPRLRRLRRDLGLTQADMAGDLDIRSEERRVGKEGARTGRSRWAPEY